MPTQDASGLPATLRDRVLERLGFERCPAPDLAGLSRLYRAWCTHVPFDNLRKMMALATQEPGLLAGTDARDFFEAWLAHGTGGTCWPTSNALFELLVSIGFEARRVAGSMRDLGIVSHGSVKVRVAGQDWLVDSSMLTNEPLPLRDSVFVQRAGPCPAEVEPSAGTHVIWAEFPPGPDPLPCRVLVDPADFELHSARYEASRERSPFNQRLYARRNRPGEVLVLLGNTRHSRTASGLTSQDCSPDEVCRSLRDEFHLSAAVVRAWVDRGGLEASFAPPSGAKPPSVTARPPSRRSGV